MANEQGRQAAQASRLPSSCTYDGVGDGVVVAAEAMLAAATLVASCKSKRFIGAFYFPPIPEKGVLRRKFSKGDRALLCHSGVSCFLFLLGVS